MKGTRWRASFFRAHCTAVRHKRRSAALTLTGKYKITSNNDGDTSCECEPRADNSHARSSGHREVIARITCRACLSLWRVKQHCIQKPVPVMVSHPVSDLQKKPSSAGKSDDRCSCSDANALTMGVGRRGKGAKGPPWFWKLTFFYYIFIKKGRFLSFEKEKWNFITFAPLWKNFYGNLWKNPLMAPPPGKNPYDVHGSDVTTWLETRRGVAGHIEMNSPPAVTPSGARTPCEKIRREITGQNAFCSNRLTSWEERCANLQGLPLLGWLVSVRAGDGLWRNARSVGGCCGNEGDVFLQSKQLT